MDQAVMAPFGPSHSVARRESELADLLALFLRAIGNWRERQRSLWPRSHGQV